MILGVLQGRLNSTRLPGKVLRPVLGEPMIVRQVERLRRSACIDRLVVATSESASDDELARELDARNIEVRRGPLNDVVGRFAAVVDEFAPDVIVRLTADCPLADHAVIDAVISAHLRLGADYTSNTLQPTFPDGLDVECISADAFGRLRALPLTPREREHVTLGLYSRPDEYLLESYRQDPDRSSLRWTVDVADDLEFVRAVYAALYPMTPDFAQADILSLITSQPDLNRTEDDLARNTGLQQK